jgi:hypothetical protein
MKAARDPADSAGTSPDSTVGVLGELLSLLPEGPGSTVAGSHRLVLFEDSRKLDRQLPAAEIDHLAAQLLLDGIERSLLEDGIVVGHGGAVR